MGVGVIEVPLIVCIIFEYLESFLDAIVHSAQAESEK